MMSGSCSVQAPRNITRFGCRSRESTEISLMRSAFAIVASTFPGLRRARTGGEGSAPPREPGARKTRASLQERTVVRHEGQRPRREGAQGN